MDFTYCKWIGRYLSMLYEKLLKHLYIGNSWFVLYAFHFKRSWIRYFNNERTFPLGSLIGKVRCQGIMQSVFLSMYLFGAWENYFWIVNKSCVTILVITCRISTARSYKIQRFKENIFISIASSHTMTKKVLVRAPPISFFEMGLEK